MKLLAVFLAFAIFQVGLSGNVPVLTAATIVGSMPGVTNSVMHQAGVTTAATVPANQSLNSCSITAGDPSGNFSCVVSGGNATIQMTSTGATNYPGSVLTASQTLTVTGTNGNGTSSGVSVVVNLYADGYAKALAGTALLPSLLSGYTAANTPQWISPGVGYGVGLPTGVTLSDPSTISITGVSCNSGSHICTVSGSQNVTIGNCSSLTGFDFSADNGWTLTGNLPSGFTLTVQCNKFGVGTNNNNPIVWVNGGEGNLVIVNNSIDGGGLNGSGANQESLIVTVDVGNLTVEYNQLTNAYVDFMDITFSQATNTSPIYKIMWNNFAGYGGVSTAHADAIQTWGLNAASMQVAFNTGYEPAPSAGFPAVSANSFTRLGDVQLHGESGDCGQTSSCVLNNPTIAYNTIIPLGDGFFNIFQIDTRAADGGVANNLPNLKIHDNYIDPTDNTTQGVYSATFLTLANGPNPQVWNAFNLLNGAVIISSNNNNFPPGTPPTAGPAATNLTNSVDVITLSGTAPSGETISVYDGNTLLGTATSSSGTFTYTSGTLSSGSHTITASDIYANSTGPQLITLP
jgi:hypothetical protein